MVRSGRSAFPTGVGGEANAAHVCAYFNFRLRVVDRLSLDISEGAVLPVRAGTERAKKLTVERGVAVPNDPWGLRDGDDCNRHAPDVDGRGRAYSSGVSPRLAHSDMEPSYMQTLG